MESTDTPEPAGDAELPEWEDAYLNDVAARLKFNYDLERDRTVRGERFPLYGRLEMSSEKHFFHPAIRFGYHESTEHLFARRRTSVGVRDVERLVELGHALADDWIDADEEHFCTEFTFVTVVDRVPDDVQSFVDGFRDRTLLKYGYFGHYEVNLIVVAPEDEDLVASSEANVAEAFRLWEPIEKEEPGWWDLITRRLQV